MEIVKEPSKGKKDKNSKLRKNPLLHFFKSRTINNLRKKYGFKSYYKWLMERGMSSPEVIRGNIERRFYSFQTRPLPPDKNGRPYTQFSNEERIKKRLENMDIFGLSNLLKSFYILFKSGELKNIAHLNYYFLVEETLKYKLSQIEPRELTEKVAHDPLWRQNDILLLFLISMDNIPIAALEKTIVRINDWLFKEEKVDFLEYFFGELPPIADFDENRSKTSFLNPTIRSALLSLAFHRLKVEGEPLERHIEEIIASFALDELDSVSGISLDLLEQEIDCLRSPDALLAVLKRSKSLPLRLKAYHYLQRNVKEEDFNLVLSSFPKKSLVSLYHTFMTTEDKEAFLNSLVIFKTPILSDLIIFEYYSIVDKILERLSLNWLGSSSLEDISFKKAIEKGLPKLILSGVKKPEELGALLLVNYQPLTDELLSLFEKALEVNSKKKEAELINSSLQFAKRSVRFSLLSEETKKKILYLYYLSSLSSNFSNDDR